MSRDSKYTIVVALIVLIVVAFLWHENTKEWQRQNELEKCENDFLESIPTYNGTTIIHESASCYLDAGKNITYIAIIGNVTDIKTRSSRTFWGTKEIEDTIFFADGEELLLYRAEGRDWRKNSTTKIMAYRYRLGNAGRITSIEVIN
ncbi:hypothetical protein KAR26_00885 [Candidatus Parcubacteria bacterium]|nr:hypothetical protein [Candidatus Parcubacteria bacterium]